MMMTMLRLLTLYIIAIGAVRGFIWPVRSVVMTDSPVLITEGYVFGINAGPPFMSQGRSYVETDLTVVAYSKTNSKVYTKILFYITDEEHGSNKGHLQLPNLCTKQTENQLQNMTSTIFDFQLINLRLNNTGYGHFADEFLQLNLDEKLEFYKYVLTPIKVKFLVTTTGWVNIIIISCDHSLDNNMMKTHGTVTFHNPYGLLPGKFYGFLLFEVVRCIGFVVGLVYFLVYYFRYYKESLLPVHHLLLFVLILSTIESSLWAIFYLSINMTGRLYVNGLGQAALILQVLRQASSRLILLIVCLGYGIVRPRLMIGEWMAMTVLTSLYVIAAGAAQINFNALETTTTTSSSSSINTSWIAVPSLLLDTCFLLWIYFALTSTLRILAEFKQTAKLKLYRRLSIVISTFTGLCLAVSLLLFLTARGVRSASSWQWAWMPQVIWEILGLTVMLALLWVCVPKKNSRLLAYASQLPTEDHDDDIGLEGHDDDLYDNNNDHDDEIELIDRKQHGHHQDVEEDDDPLEDEDERSFHQMLGRARYAHDPFKHSNNRGHQIDSNRTFTPYDNSKPANNYSNSSSSSSGREKKDYEDLPGAESEGDEEYGIRGQD